MSELSFNNQPTDSTQCSNIVAAAVGCILLLPKKEIGAFFYCHLTC